MNADEVLNAQKKRMRMLIGILIVSTLAGLIATQVMFAQVTQYKSMVDDLQATIVVVEHEYQTLQLTATAAADND